MCGIFGIINKNNNNHIEYVSKLSNKRGPESTSILNENNYVLTFHRLAINGLNTESNQPIYLNNTILICNGEIYNYKELIKKYNFIMKTNSDCEIILHLYNYFNNDINSILNLLDGVFSFILIDKNNFNYKIIIARDPYGIRPLYQYYSEELNIHAFSSELKCLTELKLSENENIKYFHPGTYTIFNSTYDSNHSKYNYTIIEKNTYFKLPNSNTIYTPFNNDKINTINLNLYNYISNAVKKRVVGTTERPIACLLSGGLDSSLIAALVNKYYNGVLETYSIGLKNSEDIKYANIVAKHIKSNHTEIILTEDEFFNSIPETIYNIESYDTTTIRASVGNYLIGKYIKNNSNSKVIFNGDGSDELMGGYLYFNKCPSSIEFDNENKRLLNNIHKYDVLRSDKSISSNGLEPRTPFLDIIWTKYYLSLPKDLRNHNIHNKQEKFLLRNAIENNDYNLLPQEILWRRKEAFSDGVSSLQKSWYQIIQDKINNLISKDSKLKTDIFNILNDPNNKASTIEQSYYYYYYNKFFYDNVDDIVENYWMPRFIEAKDASARTLSIY